MGPTWPGRTRRPQSWLAVQHPRRQARSHRATLPRAMYSRSTMARGRPRWRRHSVVRVRPSTCTSVLERQSALASRTCRRRRGCHCCPCDSSCPYFRRLGPNRPMSGQLRRPSRQSRQTAVLDGPGVRSESLRSSAPLCGRGLLESALRCRVLHFSQSFVVAERFEADLISEVELTR